jgi:hypothetical protein
MPALLVALEPAVIFTAPEVAQVLITDPATAVGAAVIVRDFVDVAFVQPEAALAVKVSVTLPALISAALGVYAARLSEVAFEKVPVPLDVHSTLTWFDALAPAVTLIDPEE